MKTILALISFVVAATTLLPFAYTTIAQRSGTAYASEGLTHGISRTQRDRIASIMRQEIAEGNFPGAVTLIAKRGTVALFEAYGYQDAAKTKPMVKDTIFRIASMTKPIVNFVTMMLVEQRVLRLDTPIAHYLPELKDLRVETSKVNNDDSKTTEDIPVNRPITIEHLLRHTAGFFYQATATSERLKNAYRQANIEANEGDITGDEMLRRLATIPLAYQPGSGHLYSISNDVLGLLLERATHKPLDVLIEELLIRPLGMKDTAFWVPADKLSRRAEMPYGSNNKTFPPDRFCNSEADIKRSYLKGGSGLCGTAEDYFKFLQMIVNGGQFRGRRYLSRDLVDKWFGGGGDGIFGTSFFVDRKTRLIIIEFTQGGLSALRSWQALNDVVHGAK